MLGFKRDPEYVASNGINTDELHDHVLNVYGEDLNEATLKQMSEDIEHAAQDKVTWDGVDIPDYLAAYYDELDTRMEDIDSIGDMLW